MILMIFSQAWTRIQILGLEFSLMDGLMTHERKWGSMDKLLKKQTMQLPFLWNQKLEKWLATSSQWDSKAASQQYSKQLIQAHVTQLEIQLLFYQLVHVWYLIFMVPSSKLYVFDSFCSKNSYSFQKGYLAMFTVS